MIRFVGAIALLLAVATAGFFAAQLATRPADPARTRAAGLTIEQVQKLATLVTLDVPLSDVHITELEGFTGGIKLVLAVRGDVQIGTDLSRARLEDIDEQQRTAVLVLPRPAPGRARLDHEKTRVLEIQRNGLWQMLPGEAGEKAATNRAMTAAQRLLTEAAGREELIVKACAHTQQVLEGFFAALGWKLVVQWDDARAVSARP